MSEDNTRGISSTKRLIGFSKYLYIELNQVDARGRVTLCYHYKVPRDLLGKALKAGGKEYEKRKRNDRGDD